MRNNSYFEKSFLIKFSLFIFLIISTLPIFAQRKDRPKTNKPTPTMMDAELLKAVEWREIGPLEEVDRLR
jgi:hypothetical protein